MSSASVCWVCWTSMLTWDGARYAGKTCPHCEVRKVRGQRHRLKQCARLTLSYGWVWSLRTIWTAGSSSSSGSSCIGCSSRRTSCNQDTHFPGLAAPLTYRVCFLWYSYRHIGALIWTSQEKNSVRGITHIVLT